MGQSIGLVWQITVGKTIPRWTGLQAIDHLAPQKPEPGWFFSGRSSKEWCKGFYGWLDTIWYRKSG